MATVGNRPSGPPAVIARERAGNQQLGNDPQRQPTKRHLAVTVVTQRLVFG